MTDAKAQVISNGVEQGLVLVTWLARCNLHSSLLCCETVIEELCSINTAALATDT